MKINLSEIYAGLKAWGAERRITAQSQKDGYIINVMEELGELADALRDYERFQNELKTCDDKEYLATAWHYNNERAQHAIIDALCDIAVFTINAGADMPCGYKPEKITCGKSQKIYMLLAHCGLCSFSASLYGGLQFKAVLTTCATLCQEYGFNFEIAMLETIKEISSRTGAYDESAKKWVKDTSDEAKSKWYKADYEKARI